MNYLTLDEIHMAEAEMLRWLDSICRNNNITLCLSGGTLLGAIRHHGFIPWDDDIDLMIARNEYDRLLDILEMTPNERYEVASMRDHQSTFAYAKIIDKAIHLDQDITTQEVTSNLWIDIFPVDGLPDDSNKIKKVYAKAKFFRMGLRVATSHDLEAGSTLKRIIKPIVLLPAKIIGAKYWLRHLDAFCRKIKFGDTATVGVLCAGYGYREAMPIKEWVNYVEVEFEGGKYYAPGCWKHYLENLYGNYMMLPPEEKRHIHNLKAYLSKGYN